MNGVLWAWVLKKAWKIDMKVLHKSLIGNGTEFENYRCKIEQGANEVISGMAQNGKTEETV